MAQFYTLEEAARVLGMDPEELKTEAQHRKVRAFLDGGTWRFRVGDVDELARRRGMGSDAELPLSDLDLPPVIAEESSSSIDEIDLSEFQLGVANPDLGAVSTEVAPQKSPASDSGDQDMLIDDLSLPPTTMTSSSVIIGMQTTGGRMPSDSDVRLIPDNTSGSGSRASDSDVRLAPAEFKPKGDSDVKPAKPKSKTPGDSDVTLRQPGDSDVTLVAGDSSSQDSLFVAPVGLSDTAVRQSPQSGSSSGSGSSAEAAIPGFDSDADSDFDLTPSSIEDALAPDSGSDFELTALEGSDEFEATPLAGPSDSDVTAADPGFSGINLSRPSDSGINLQMASGLGLGGAESIELAPLSGSNIKPVPAPPGKPKPSLAQTPPPSRKPPEGKGKGKPEKDIFDDTDFEVDALDSDHDSEDRTMQLEAQSDFELEDADTGSEVFAIDEEDVDQNAATALGPAGSSGSRGAVSGDEEDAFGGAAVADEGSSGWDVESEAAPAAPVAGRVPQPQVLAGAGASAEWGGLWVGMLGFATLLMLFLTFVSLDLVRNLYDFRGDSPASGIVKTLAGLIGG
jgi:hypothetical protein